MGWSWKAQYWQHIPFGIFILFFKEASSTATPMQLCKHELTTWQYGRRYISFLSDTCSMDDFFGHCVTLFINLSLHYFGSRKRFEVDWAQMANIMGHVVGLKKLNPIVLQINGLKTYVVGFKCKHS